MTNQGHARGEQERRSDDSELTQPKAELEGGEGEETEEVAEGEEGADEEVKDDETAS